MHAKRYHLHFLWSSLNQFPRGLCLDVPIPETRDGKNMLQPITNPAGKMQLLTRCSLAVRAVGLTGFFYRAILAAWTIRFILAQQSHSLLSLQTADVSLQLTGDLDNQLQILGCKFYFRDGTTKVVPQECETSILKDKEWYYSGHIILLFFTLKSIFLLLLLSSGYVHTWMRRPARSATYLTSHKVSSTTFIFWWRYMCTVTLPVDKVSQVVQ